MVFFKSEEERRDSVVWFAGLHPEKKDKLRVLVIDDDPSELQKGVAAAKAHGWWVLGINPLDQYTDHVGFELEQYLSRADAIITDLCWDENPEGLIVVIDALSLGKPVVVCTNGRTEDGGHANIGFVQSYVYVKNPLPFGWVETKNWTDAALQLENRLKK
jgi:glycosyltransferase involved in cell wall biosynthesis